MFLEIIYFQNFKVKVKNIVKVQSQFKVSSQSKFKSLLLKKFHLFEILNIELKTERKKL